MSRRCIPFFLCLLPALLPAASCELAVGEEAVLELPTRTSAAALVFRWQGPARQRPPWLSAELIATDDRRFPLSRSLPLTDGAGRVRWPLDAATWCGDGAILDADALRSCRRIRLQLAGAADSGSFRCSLGVASAASDTSADSAPQTTASEPRLRLTPDSWVGHQAWRELRVELLGVTAADQRVELVGLGERPVPGFLQQPLRVAGDHWQAYGEARWVFRLRPDEGDPAGARIHLGDWRSPPLPELVLQTVPAPTAPTALTIPLFAASDCPLDRHTRLLPGKPPVLADSDRRLLCLAPQLTWQAAWSGYRGPELIGHQAAAAWDVALIDGCQAIDLLPQRLFDEQSALRFGLSPWSRAQGGPWRQPGSALAADQARQDLTRHARELIARCRATPGLEAWLASCTEPLSGDAARAGLADWQQRLARHLARYETRPLLIRHPLSRPYDQAASEGVRPWFDFERGARDWQRGDAPLASERSGPPPDLSSLVQASHGRRSLALPLPVSQTQPVSEAGAFVALDADCFDVDRIECDLLLTGGGGMATVYCWITDAEHRWYQAELGHLRPGTAWRTVGVDLADPDAWQPAGHLRPWDPDRARRIRRFGISCYHHRTSVERATPTVCYVDDIRRLRWPRLAEQPSVTVSQMQAPATATALATWTARFQLAPAVANPFDPERADVRIEWQRPDDSRLIRPAYWLQDQRIDLQGARTRVEATGSSAWQCHLAPDRPGTWRWRLLADLRWRDQTLSHVGPWQECRVAAADDDALLPVRRSADPRWWERSDGSWFYPVGINLRSPGDERQNDLLKNADSDQRSADWEDQGLAAYRDWFDHMQAAEMNYARIWMCPWWCGLEWTREWNGFGGLGWYHQGNAARLDAICQLAAERGIYLQIELQNHGMTSPHIDGQWELSPYNRANGGPAASAADFFDNPDCWEATRKRHRYVLARWGHLPHIMAWVLSSEMEFTGDWYAHAYHKGYRDPDAVSQPTMDWVATNIDWLHEHDYWQRPVSIHFSHPWRARPLWKLPTLGFSNSNVYTGFQSEMNRLGGRKAGLASGFHYYLTKYFPPWELGRPSMLGEWGGHWHETRPEKLRAELHTGLWMQAVLPFGGNVGFWWWLWVDATDRWDEYRAVARFRAGDDPRGQDFKPVIPRPGSERAWVYGMAGDSSFRLYAWIRGLDRDFDKDPIEDAGSCRLTSRHPNRRWRLERWNCSDGSLEASRELTSDRLGHIDLPLGRLDPDAAYKLDLIDPPAPRPGDQTPTSAP